ncbi:MAG TPA: hypothetical protein VHA12_02610 [Candidatus Nanoarchaeia archaeon]|nr:hypothetical protein [Candidatus Nanoarchaeia archaeon]
MKKRGLFFIFISLIILSSFSISAEEDHQNTSITGKLTSQPFNLAVQVIAIYPSLEIISPKNNTYWQNQTFLNYSVSDAAHVWYSLDAQQNITLTSSKFFNTSAGSHSISLYANNTAGYLVYKNVNFSIDLNKIHINYSNFSNSGESTEFAIYSFEELQNFTNVIFEKPLYGKIKFNEAINVTNIIPNESMIDLNKYVKISYNSISVDSVALANFNKSATVTLYDLPYVTPRILRDGVPCPQNECIFQSYTFGTLVFNVSHFTTYSTEEGDNQNSDSSSGNRGSGGGGGGSTNNYFSDKNVQIIDNKLAVSIKQGETRRSQFIVENNEKKKINLTFEIQDPDKLILLNFNSLDIEPGQKKEIPFDVIAREDTVPDVYIKQIIVRENGKEIGRANIVIDVSSKQSLFDVKLNLIENKIPENDKLIAEIQLYNFGETGRVDTELEYIIKDVNNVEIYKDHQTAAVETQLSLVKIIKTHGIKPGNYILYVKSTYDGKVASSSQWFEITKTGIDYNMVILVLMILLVIASIAYAIKNAPSDNWFERLETKIKQEILKRRVKKAAEKAGVVAVAKQITPDNSKLGRLKQQLKQLEYVHSKGLVEDSEYQLTKSEIESKISDLNNRR